MPWNEGREISVEEIQALVHVSRHPTLPARSCVGAGLPIAALLESLFYKTPCGSFVFWKSEQKSAHGTHFLGGATTAHFLLRRRRPAAHPQPLQRRE